MKIIDYLIKSEECNKHELKQILETCTGDDKDKKLIELFDDTFEKENKKLLKKRGLRW